MEDPKPVRWHTAVTSLPVCTSTYWHSKQNIFPGNYHSTISQKTTIKFYEFYGIFLQIWQFRIHNYFHKNYYSASTVQGV